MVGSQKDFIKRAEEILSKGIRQKVFPGASVLISTPNKITLSINSGNLTYETISNITGHHTLFDLASLTKIFTSIAIMQLHEQGLLDVMDPVSRFIGELSADKKYKIKIWNILTHTSGFDSFQDQEILQIHSKEDLIEQICLKNLLFLPGTNFLYTDLGFILLGVVIERVTGESLDCYIHRNIFNPLGMQDTSFLPLVSKSVNNIAPTENDERGEMLQGMVHDEKARIMGGVAGHSGIFSTSQDLGKFLTNFLNILNGAETSVLRPTTAREMIKIQAPSVTPSQGLGWFIGLPFMGIRASASTFGHTGFTGVSFWANYPDEIVCIFLSNCVHPVRPSKEKRELLMSIRQEISNLAFDFLWAQKG